MTIAERICTAWANTERNRAMSYHATPAAQTAWDAMVQATRDPDIADYRGFHVWHEMHPVWPSMDWRWAPIDHDEECPSDRCGTGPTQESCIDQISELLQEEAFRDMRSDRESMMDRDDD